MKQGLVIWLILFGFAATSGYAQSSSRNLTDDCRSQGWSPAGVRLKDHTIFRYQEYYYLASIYISESHYEDRFAYARSQDLCLWEELPAILADRPPDEWDDFRIWAPYVLEEEGVYYLFYTGVTRDITQSILVATSTDPADPIGWQSQGVVFQPFHPGMNWPGKGAWSDARDPMVLKADDRYYLYYTGLDHDGGIIGVATATTPLGPWWDRGATLKLPDAMPESPGVFVREGSYYLYYNRTLDGTGPEIRVGPSPQGPWSPPRPLRPGWAHEFWLDANAQWMASYVTTFAVAFRPVIWDTVGIPPRPWLTAAPGHLWVPFVGIPRQCDPPTASQVSPGVDGYADRLPLRPGADSLCNLSS